MRHRKGRFSFLSIFLSRLNVSNGGGTPGVDEVRKKMKEKEVEGEGHFDYAARQEEKKKKQGKKIGSAHNAVPAHYYRLGLLWTKTQNKTNVDEERKKETKS